MKRKGLGFATERHLEKVDDAIHEAEHHFEAGLKAVTKDCGLAFDDFVKGTTALGVARAHKRSAGHLEVDGREAYVRKMAQMLGDQIQHSCFRRR